MAIIWVFKCFYNSKAIGVLYMKIGISNYNNKVAFKGHSLVTNPKVSTASG